MTKRTVRQVVRLTAPERDQLDRLTDQLGESRSNTIRRAIKELALKHKEKLNG